jgi:methionine salvage enolase-phosphatase E1
MNLFYLDTEPVKLYTYETASVRNRILKFKAENEVYGELRRYIQKYFGCDIDNKICIEIETEAGTTAYVGFWDGDIVVGTDVFFLADLSDKWNSYRVIQAIK